jgi:hypothetical protein
MTNQLSQEITGEYGARWEERSREIEERMKDKG